MGYIIPYIFKKIIKNFYKIANAFLIKFIGKVFGFR